jgi:hypothetical protein
VPAFNWASDVKPRCSECPTDAPACYEGLCYKPTLQEVAAAASKNDQISSSNNKENGQISDERNNHNSENSKNSNHNNNLSNKSYKEDSYKGNSNDVRRR